MQRVQKNSRFFKCLLWALHTWNSKKLLNNNNKNKHGFPQYPFSFLKTDFCIMKYVRIFFFPEIIDFGKCKSDQTCLPNPPQSKRVDGKVKHKCCCAVQVHQGETITQLPFLRLEVHTLKLSQRKCGGFFWGFVLPRSKKYSKLTV